MTAVTLTTLRSRVRELADMVGSSFVTDAATSLDAFINAGLQKLHDKVLDAMGDDALGVSSSALTPTIASGTVTVALPADFYRLLGVELVVGGERIDLRRFSFKERNAARGSWLHTPSDVPKYRLEGSNLRLSGPDGAYTGTLWYAPHQALLTASDSCDFPNGWEQYAVLYAAMLALTKEESDATVIANLLNEESERIDSAAARRNQGGPPQVTDVEAPLTDGGTTWEV